MKRQSIAITAVVISIVAIAIVSFFFYQQQPDLTLEIGPKSPFIVTQGNRFSLDISVRNKPGFRPAAKKVRGEMRLPEGFIEESMQTRTRQLIFGSVPPGDASHYGFEILVSNSTDTGEYSVQIIIWGSNITELVRDIEVVVVAS